MQSGGAPDGAARTAPDYAFLLAALLAIGASLWAVPWPESLPGAGLGALAAAIARTDMREFRIPDIASGAAAGLALASAALSFDMTNQVALALARGLVAFGAFFAFRELYRRWRGVQGLGFGDVKLAGVAGLWLDLGSFSLCLELACSAALAYIVFRRLFRGEALDPLRRLPFGAFFAPAIWIAWLLQSAHI